MIKTCKICEKEFHVKPSRFNIKLYCSKQCMIIKQKRDTGEKNNNYKGGAKPFICENCNKNFYAGYLKKRRFCTYECSNLYRKKNKLKHSLESIIKMKISKLKNPRVYVLKKYYCECGNEMNKSNKTCNECRNKKTSHLNKICVNCEKMFRAAVHTRKTCSLKCQKESRIKLSSGKKNPNWKGGLKLINQKDRNNSDHNEWISKVFIRDNYTCQSCGQIGWELHAHHIKYWAKHPELRTELSNGITLCKKCHRKKHIDEAIERNKKTIS